MGRHYSLSGGDPDTTHLVASHGSGQEEDCPNVGNMGPLLNRNSDLSVRIGVLLYKQLNRPMMDYACPSWRSPARSRMRKIHLLQSKCFRLATGTPWYVSNRQIHKDLCVPLFADHISALTGSFDSKLTDVGNSLIRQLGIYISWPRIYHVAWGEIEGRHGPEGHSSPSPSMCKSSKRIAFGPV
jgi:hypothetical protein